MTTGRINQGASLSKCRLRGRSSSRSRTRATNNGAVVARSRREWERPRKGSAAHALTVVATRPQDTRSRARARRSDRETCRIRRRCVAGRRHAHTHSPSSPLLSPTFLTCCYSRVSRFRKSRASAGRLATSGRRNWAPISHVTSGPCSGRCRGAAPPCSGARHRPQPRGYECVLHLSESHASSIRASSNTTFPRVRSTGRAITSGSVSHFHY